MKSQYFADGPCRHNPSDQIGAVSSKAPVHTIQYAASPFTTV